MWLKRLQAAIASSAFLMVSAHLLAQAPDPLIGTWELNLSKSKFVPGPAPRSETRTYVVSGADVKATAKGVGPDGKPTSSEWIVNEDGKDRPATGAPDLDAISFKRIDRFTVAFTQKRAGKIVSTGTRTISKDGKVMTLTIKGTDAKGQTFNDVSVFEKR